jgi:hypothetical protein
MKKELLEAIWSINGKEEFQYVYRMYCTIRITKTRTIKSLFGYLSNNSDVPSSEGDWPKTIHGELKELKPDDDPEPQGWFVKSTKCFDSNMKHQTLSAIIETAAYGSVFDSVWNCIKKIIDLPNMQRYLGEPIRDKSHMADSSLQVNAKMTHHFVHSSSCRMHHCQNGWIQFHHRRLQPYQYSQQAVGIF